MNFIFNIADKNQVLMPVYSLYIIGFLMLLMLGVIIWLAVLLYRNKTKEYNIFSPTNQLQPVTTNPDINRTLMTQTSHEMTILKMDTLLDVPPITQPKPTYPDSLQNSLTLSSSSKDLNRSAIDRHTGLGKDFKVYRSVKKPVDQQLILKEQMKKICEDALARSNINGMKPAASLKDLNALLQEKNNQNHDSVTGGDENSSDYLDLEVYDNAPSNIPVNEMPGEAVYDCLPSSRSNNIIVEDNDTKYLLAISRENIQDQTDSLYMNAQYRYNKFQN